MTKLAYTVDYRCSKCREGSVKLWRGIHGAPDKDGNELLCARCLAPDAKVGDDGRGPSRIPGLADMLTDQVMGWLPAVPIGDTFWGYTSVPDCDVAWWKALPTYPAVELTRSDTR